MTRIRHRVYPTVRHLCSECHQWRSINYTPRSTFVCRICRRRRTYAIPEKSGCVGYRVVSDPCDAPMATGAVVSAEEAKYAVSHGCFVEGMKLERGGRVYVVRAARLEREAS